MAGESDSDDIAFQQSIELQNDTNSKSRFNQNDEPKYTVPMAKHTVPMTKHPQVMSYSFDAFTYCKSH